MREKGISEMDFILCGKLHEQANQHRWKTVRGDSRATGEESGLYVVSVWVKEDNVSFGQIRAKEKNNKITAIPQLLDGPVAEGAPSR